ncbi:MAG TPA: DNA-binding response regulator [Muricauda sp.]|uniref:Response regulator transcription factor n=1 Tax=Flagellimonas aurea TaxID=2915619 RepID=A0ABS3G2V2_9FLAO|nr:response regulator transcription factor [Allomuricauda aurea]MBC71250.1 DNA-binding response regulator [Allomuricauda sp.]MBO0353364.1 response regulator transcription factor [Allomuricauda aurea]UBZ13527.1 response regulator transcription factor [Allomuricauda aquimarina]HBU78355.1 DNA-binding response regulator [Allomuricauda sp.]|tara:strand:- start:509 stop:1195 length:687 start_codon:yes stop_codon:yes gene_type:complete
MQNSEQKAIITIVLADDHSLVRDGIRALLEEEPGLDVIGEVSNGLDALKMVDEKSPDILIIDIRMPELGGIETVERLNAKGKSNTKCIILSMHDSEEYILKSVQAGANGYLLKDTGKAEFVKAIHMVQEGGKYFSGDISNVLVNNLFSSDKKTNQSSSKANKSTPFDLTNKELQVLELVLAGYTNKEISEKLQNSKRTIETHRFNLMKKMEVKNLIDLSKKANKYNLV